MEQLPRLNFPQYKFRVSRSAAGMRIWDALRGCWLVLTPEEWVRQHLVRFLCEDCGAPRTLLKQECPVAIQGMNQRADIVVYGSDALPLLLAECKSPEVEITRAVFDQAVRYNTVLGARYLAVTNGVRHFIHERTADGKYAALARFPDLGIKS